MASRKESSALRQLYSFASELSGKNGEKIARVIGDGATDEKIEKKTKIKMSEIRAILNQLHNHGIAEYTREKNMDSGWFTYTWRINLNRAMENFLHIRRNEYMKLKEQMCSEEGKMFYKCRKNCGRIPFDEAMDTKFKCPTCNGRLKYANNDDEIRELARKISALEKIVNVPKEELAPQVVETTKK